MKPACPTNPPIDPVVAELLRVRKEKGLRQQDVADQAGISRRSLVSIESGGDCTLSTLRRLAAALGVDIEPVPAKALPAQSGPLARSFATAQEMSAHQEQRELAEALRVRAMMPFERSRWLAASWGALQRQAQAVARSQAPAQAGTQAGIQTGTARHFATMQAKNRFDEERETAQALQLALSRSAR